MADDPRPTTTEHAFPEPALLGESLYARCYANVDGLTCALCGEHIGWRSGDADDPGGWTPFWSANSGEDPEDTLLCEACSGWLEVFVASGSPLHDLLADHDRALGWLNEVTFNAVAKPGEAQWAEAQEWYREYWAEIKAKQHGAVLSALRNLAHPASNEVAKPEPGAEGTR